MDIDAGLWTCKTLEWYKYFKTLISGKTSNVTFEHAKS